MRNVPGAISALENGGPHAFSGPMLQSLIARLTGRRPDPTRRWPRCYPDTPMVDLARGTVGSLRFGDAIDCAQCFGRPDRFRWSRPDYCELLYAGAGFEIDFDGGRLAYVAFFLGPDECLPKCSELRFASMWLDGRPISKGTSLPEIQTVFGRPVSAERGEDEIVVCYVRNGLLVEFEATPAGALKRANVFPERQGEANAEGRRTPRR